MKRGPKPTLLVDRFWGHVDKSGGPDACWPFTGSVDKKGYGRIKARRGEYATGCKHRFPDGTRCTLSPEAHTEVAGLARVHNYPLTTEATPA